MRNALVFVLGAIMAMGVFVFFVLDLDNKTVFFNVVCKAVRDIIDAYMPMYYEIFSFEPLKKMVGRAIDTRGLNQTLVDFSVLAALKEEIIYRSPVWIFCFISFLIGVRAEWQRVLAMLILFIPTMIWSYPHDYPVFYKGCVFFGGIISGLFTIYIMHKKHGWWITLFLPILLHGLFNFGFILIVWKFLL